MGSNKLFYLAAAWRECVCVHMHAPYALMLVVVVLSFFFESSLAPQCPLCVTAVDGASLPRWIDRSVSAFIQLPCRNHCVVAHPRLAWFCLVNWPRGMSTADPTDFCSILFSVRSVDDGACRARIDLAFCNIIAAATIMGVNQEKTMALLLSPLSSSSAAAAVRSPHSR